MLGMKERKQEMARQAEAKDNAILDFLKRNSGLRAIKFPDKSNALNAAVIMEHKLSEKVCAKESVKSIFDIAFTFVKEEIHPNIRLEVKSIWDNCNRIADALDYRINEVPLPGVKSVIFFLFL